jgi:hypothetical protein
VKDKARMTWTKAQIRAKAGKPTKHWAWIVAGNWIAGLQDCCSPELPDEIINSIHYRLHGSMVREVVNTLKTGNNDFWRHFGEVLARKGEPWCRSRDWLVRMHRIGRDGKKPAYTSTELLADAKARHIPMSLRQLTRLMDELRFKYKYAHRRQPRARQRKKPSRN